MRETHLSQRKTTQRFLLFRTAISHGAPYIAKVEISGGFREGLMGLMLGLAPLVFKLAHQFFLAPRDKINPPSRFSLKSLKIVATRCQILRLKCSKFDFGSLRPRPGLGSLSAPPDPLVELRRQLLKGEDGRGKVSSSPAPPPSFKILKRPIIKILKCVRATADVHAQRCVSLQRTIIIVQNCF